MAGRQNLCTDVWIFRSGKCPSGAGREYSISYILTGSNSLVVYAIIFWKVDANINGGKDSCESCPIRPTCSNERCSKLLELGERATLNNIRNLLLVPYFKHLFLCMSDGCARCAPVFLWGLSVGLLYGKFMPVMIKTTPLRGENVGYTVLPITSPCPL